MAKLTYDPATKSYVWTGRYTERKQPERAGFNWHRFHKRWQTQDAHTASRLLGDVEMSEELETQIVALTEATQKAIDASYAATCDAYYPVPLGKEYLPFQRAGIAYGLDRDAVLIGDEMGLGKTIQAIGIINSSPMTSSVLIVAPKSLLVNWMRELQAWLTSTHTIGIATGKHWPNTSIVIINYDILLKHEDNLRSKVWDVLVCDECHKLKNERAKRTQMIVGRPRGRAPLAPVSAHKKILLSGTPMPNRPLELWPILHFLDGHTFRSFRKFAYRYCDAFQSDWGLDATGATNLDELRELLRSTVMIRRKKADVMKELPAKIRQVIELPFDKPKRAAEIAKRETAILEQVAAYEGDCRALSNAASKEYEQGVRNLKAKLDIIFEEVATLRHDTALDKVPVVTAYLFDTLDSSDKIVVFAHHRSVIREIKDALEEKGIRTAVITGATKDRQTQVDLFQNDPEVRVFLGNIMAAGEGLTLTAASHVVFAELDWTSGVVEQAESRCHRVGTKNTVLVQHLVLENSLDAIMAKRLVRKQRVIDNGLDGGVTHAESHADSVLSLLSDNATGVGKLARGVAKAKAKKGITEDEWRLMAWR